MTLLPQALIRKKRDGGALSTEEIQFFIAGVTDQSIPDYQVAAMLMAIFLRGLSDRELEAWAQAMLVSGEVLQHPRVKGPKIDKHSTGGVGDKISLPLAPAVAALGVAVPMVSGRGLGHSGGTLDKLEAIPGFDVRLSAEQFERQLVELGVAMIGQTEAIAPADRRLYALRDVTSTVESIPLIASSIMSKKLAEGIDGLVLDMKVGQGAFMSHLDKAKELFRAMQTIGHAAKKKITGVFTDMNAPIGRLVGHALEVKESIAILRGEGPEDTRELTVVLGAEMLMMAGKAKDQAEGKTLMEGVLGDGRGLAKFRALVAAQGGDPRAVDEPEKILPKAKNRRAIAAPRGGYVAGIHGYEVGIATIHLGGGRKAASDRIDAGVGIEIVCHIGDAVEPGQPIAYLHENGNGVAEAEQTLAKAFSFSDSPVVRGSRILEVLR